MYSCVTVLCKSVVSVVKGNHLHSNTYQLLLPVLVDNQPYRALYTASNHEATLWYWAKAHTVCICVNCTFLYVTQSPLLQELVNPCTYRLECKSATTGRYDNHNRHGTMSLVITFHIWNERHLMQAPVSVPECGSAGQHVG